MTKKPTKIIHTSLSVPYLDDDKPIDFVVEIADRFLPETTMVGRVCSVKHNYFDYVMVFEIKTGNCTILFAAKGKQMLTLFKNLGKKIYIKNKKDKQ